MRKPPFQFKNNDNAAQKNARILKKHDWNLRNVIDRHEHTAFHPGTKFRAVEDLQNLLGEHKDWSKFEKILKKGVEYGFKRDLIYSEETRINDLKESLERGNNKSALEKEHHEFIKNNYSKEVSKGWMILIPKREIPNLKGYNVIPIGIAKQFTVNN